MNRIKNSIWSRFIIGILASLLMSAFIVFIGGAQVYSAGHFLSMAVDAFFFIQPAVFLIFWFSQRRLNLKSFDFGLFVLFVAAMLLRMKL